MPNLDQDLEAVEAASDIVLLSGGIDSATALALAVKTTRQLSALFVDYGQASATSERAASVAVASHYQIVHQTLQIADLSFGAGEIRGRNAFLLHAAMLACSNNVGALILAIHSGTTYRDCTVEFVNLMQQSFDFHTGGALVVAAPFVAMNKVEIYQVAKRLDVPLQLTYSCETGNSPCGACLSCVDREALLAGA
jgi:7-cyano-7-deazaguanine synthase